MPSRARPAASNVRRKLRSLHECELILNFRGRGWKLIIPED